MNHEDDGVNYDGDIGELYCENFMRTLKRLDVTNRVVYMLQARALYLFHTDKELLAKLRQYQDDTWWSA